MEIPDSTSEQTIIRELERLKEDTSLSRAVRFQTILNHVDALLKRYPNTAYKDEALILKLDVYSGLAQADRRYVQELLVLTDSIACEKPQGRLASENAYYAIQAFVHGARLEDMPEERRLMGARERYEAFLEDYPESHRSPIIAASLVRNLLAQGEVAEAEKWVKKLHEVYPDHMALRRAEGELRRVQAVGKPFQLAHTFPDGATLRTSEYRGKVIVIQFWSAWNDTIIARLPRLVKLHEEFAPQGLQLIGVNLDRDRAQAESVVASNKMTWPQFFDSKGLDSELLVNLGIIRLPSYFVIDRNGVLRSVDDGSKLHDLVAELIAEPTP